MLPWDDLVDIGYTTRSAARASRPRGEFEIMYLNTYRDAKADSPSFAETHGVLKDLVFKIRNAPSLRGMAEHIKDQQKYAAVYNNNEPMEFTSGDKGRIDIALFARVLDSLEAYRHISLPDSADEAIGTVNEAMEAAAYLGQEETLRKALTYAMRDRLTNAAAHNETAVLSANEIALVWHVAKATGIFIPEGVKKFAFKGLLEKHINEIAVSRMLEFDHAAASVRTVKKELLGADLDVKELEHISGMYLAHVQRAIERDVTPYYFSREIAAMKEAFEELDVEFTPAMKAHFYPMIVEKGLSYIYAVNNTPAADHRGHSGAEMAEALEELGVSESAAAVERIRIESAIARGGIRQYREDTLAEIQNYIPANLRGPSL